MDSKKPVRAGTRASRTALAVAVTMTVCWSSGALGRTQPGPDCGVGAGLEEIRAPAGTLVLTPVDHVPTETDTSELASVELDTATDDNVAPLLDLSPQINETSREIFDEGSDDSRAQELTTSPIAESDEVKNLSELSDESTPVEATVEEDDLPLLRRQMYRIDI